MPRIERLTAREVLDSRGRPTVLARCETLRGCGEASVPSGASTGAAEAIELRDGDPARYMGMGCRKAVAVIEGEIQQALRGQTLAGQQELDLRLVELDGTAQRSRLGGNSILAVSLAFARAAAAENKQQLWEYLAALVNLRPRALPRLIINLFSGGKHAGGQIPIQDVLIVPMKTVSVDETLVIAFNIYQAAAKLVKERYDMRLLRADEGGMAPPARGVDEILALAVESIEAAGYHPGEEVALGVDIAASHFFKNGVYALGPERLSSGEMIARLKRWVAEFPIVSVEDGLAEEDWDNWPRLREAIGPEALVVGDDLLCTQPRRIRRAIDLGAADALLLKVNQAGTLTEAAEAMRLARSAGWRVVLSVRSGETEDNWAADLAVGWCADQFKNGSITQSERLAKLNRLLEIEQNTRFSVLPWK